MLVVKLTILKMAFCLRMKRTKMSIKWNEPLGTCIREYLHKLKTSNRLNKNNPDYLPWYHLMATFFLRARSLILHQCGFTSDLYEKMWQGYESSMILTVAVVCSESYLLALYGIISCATNKTCLIEFVYHFPNISKHAAFLHQIANWVVGYKPVADNWLQR